MAGKILNEMNTGNLSDDIIKHMAPHFYLNKEETSNPKLLK